MEDYKECLRRIALHDEALVQRMLSEEHVLADSTLDARTEALVRIAATVAVDAATSSFQHAAAHALAAGATNQEIVATLLAVAPVKFMPLV